MSQIAEKHARSFVVMIAAGGAMDDVLEMAQTFGVRAVQVQQLAVPDEERAAQRMLAIAVELDCAGRGHLPRGRARRIVDAARHQARGLR